MRACIGTRTVVMRWLSTLSRHLQVWRPAITRTYIGARTAVMRRRESISRHWDVLRSAWEDQRQQGPTVGLTGREAQFLPAVMEIQDAPPSPVGRAVGGTIIGVFAVGILWASVGHIDIVAVGAGDNNPPGPFNVVHPPGKRRFPAVHWRGGPGGGKRGMPAERGPT